MPLPLRSSARKSGGSSTQMLVSDSFSVADVLPINASPFDYAFGGILTGLSWASSSANLGIQSNKVYASATSSLKSARVNLSRKNAYVEIFYDTAHGQNVGVVGRWVDSSNFYRLWVQSDGTVVIEKVIAAVATALWTSSAGVGGVGKRHGLYINGTSLAAYVNGSVLTPITDSSILETDAGNSWGLNMNAGATAGRLDNFKVATAPLP